MRRHEGRCDARCRPRDFYGWTADMPKPKNFVVEAHKHVYAEAQILMMVTMWHHRCRSLRAASDIRTETEDRLSNVVGVDLVV